MEQSRRSDECGNPLPEGWAETTLSEIAAVNPKNGELSNLLSGFIPMALAPTDFNGSLEFEEREWDEIKKKYTHFANGDVIFAKVTPCFENGKAAIVGELPNGIGAGSSEFYVLRPSNKGISASYIFAILKSHEFMQTGAENMTGAVGLRRVPKKFVEGFKINLPPPAEQKVIADKLDTLLAQVETTKARLDRIPQILKTFRQSVLAAAVSGKLTEEWRKKNDCTVVENSLADILVSRSKLVTSRTKTPQLHLPEDEFDIHKSWKWVSLDLLSAKIVDGVHHKPTYTESGVPFMSVKDIKNGKVSFNYCKYISLKTHAEIHPRCNPEKGDLLITKSGTIGRTAIVESDKVFDLFVSVALIKPAAPNVNMKFIDLALRNWINSIDISSRVVGTAIKNLHLRDMRVLAIPFAPLQEQTEIVRQAEQLFAHADKIEQQVQAAQQRVNKLTQSILAKAFRGELTAQWRKDNPDLINGDNSAEALLAKIKAERDKLKPEKKTRKKK